MDSWDIISKCSLVEKKHEAQDGYLYQLGKAQDQYCSSGEHSSRTHKRLACLCGTV